MAKIYYMQLSTGIIGLVIFGMSLGCNSTKKETITDETYPDVMVVGAMKNVMWKGELGSRIKLDSISNKTGLYGLGPERELRGELLIIDGQSYVSRVTSDSTITVGKSYEVSAPFFVYANVTKWNEIKLPSTIKSIQDLDKFIDEHTAEYKRPFAFKLDGTVSKATIHVQDLPEGTKVSSPADAHQGQFNEELENQEVAIVGFFSTEHKGIFTHHDSNVHMHLITKDKLKMGHLDVLAMDQMTLYLPTK